jgi:Sec-independent protein secretion pathway component TatC
MYALYEVSIWLVWLIERANARRDAARAAEETYGGVAP